jgi:hypothetical protein
LHGSKLRFVAAWIDSIATVRGACSGIVRLTAEDVIRVFLRHNPRMRIPASRYHHHRFPAEIISHCVWLYFRTAPSFRDVEEMLEMRGISSNVARQQQIEKTLESTCKSICSRDSMGQCVFVKAIRFLERRATASGTPRAIALNSNSNYH